MPRWLLHSFLPLGLALSWMDPAACAASDWEPVPPEDLASTRATVEPGADAEAIFWRAWVSDDTDEAGVQSTREHYVRVKVYTARGAEQWSQVHILAAWEGVRLAHIRARTILPDGRIVPMDPHAVVDETVVRLGRARLRRRSLPMPSVAPGAIVEYRYTEVYYDRIADWEMFNFQLDVAAREVTYYLRPLDLPGFHLRQVAFHVAPRTSTRAVNGYFATTATAVPAFRAEPHMPPEWQQRAWMLLYYSDDKDVPPDRYWTRFGRDQAEEFEAQTRPDDATRRLARTVVDDATAEEEQTRRLCVWCRRELRRVTSTHPDTLKQSAVGKNRNGRDVLRRRAGTAWDVDLAFAALARACGLETRLVRMPSRSGVFFDRSMTNGDFLSSSEVALRIDGAWRCFDPQALEVAWDMIPGNEEGQLALLCDRDSSRFIVTPMAEPDRSRLGRSATLSLSEAGDLEGDLRLSFEGHCNEDLRSALADSLESSLAAVLIDHAMAHETPDILMAPRMVADEARTDAMTATCRMKLDARASATGRRLVIEPSVFHSQSAPLFTAATRIHPVYFEHPWEERDTILIRLPPGWKVEEIETPKPVHSPGVASYTAQIAVSDDGSQLLYFRTLRMGENGVIYFPADSYESVRRFFDRVHEADRFAVTLVRVEAAH